MTTGGFSSKRLARVRDVLGRHVDAGYAPGAVAVLARHGEVHIEAIGILKPGPSKARLPVASMRTSPWRAMTAIAPGA